MSEMLDEGSQREQEQVYGEAVVPAVVRGIQAAGLTRRLNSPGGVAVEMESGDEDPYMSYGDY